MACAPLFYGENTVADLYGEKVVLFFGENGIFLCIEKTLENIPHVTQVIRDSYYHNVFNI